MLTIESVYHASNILLPVVRRTDIIYAPKLSAYAGVYLKTENLQVTGSFKIRGAYYKINELTTLQKANGVVACSAGNHAQGIAMAAQKNNIKALICLPSCAPISKIKATQSYGSKVCLVPGTYDDAYKKAVSLRDEHGYTLVHPFDDESVIAGQGTIALEILNQLPDVEAIVVPVGGGGLISGIAFTAKTLKPSVEIYGVQAEGAASMLASLRAGKITELPSVSTIADGISVKKSGRLTFEICSKYVDDIVTVSDEEISSAIVTLIEQHKLVAEGAGAVAVAAIMFGKLNLQGKKTVCLISGGNIDLSTLSKIIQNKKEK